MTAITSDFDFFRFSSEDLPPADRLPFCREVVGRMVVRTDIEPLDEKFVCRAIGYRFSDLRLASFPAASAVRLERTRDMVEGNSGLVLLMNLAGSCRISQFGRQASVPAGSSILFSSADPSQNERTASRFIAIEVPRIVLAPMLATPDAALMTVIPSTFEPLRLLTGYIDLLIKDPALMETAESRRLAVTHVQDLVAMTFGATREAAEIAAGRGLRAARMRAIKADIAQNLAGNVTTAALSARHRLSPRYIRKLFESENTSLSQFVLGQRLMRVRRMLTDPRHADRTIADIVLAVGFEDISTFNRAFRRRFNMTPSDVRAAARKGMM